MDRKYLEQQEAQGFHNDQLVDLTWHQIWKLLKNNSIITFDAKYIICMYTYIDWDTEQHIHQMHQVWPNEKKTWTIRTNLNLMKYIR